eukprot:87643-Pyramimonas_sp.AAC.1
MHPRGVPNKPAEVLHERCAIVTAKYTKPFTASSCGQVRCRRRGRTVRSQLRLMRIAYSFLGAAVPT